MQLAEQDRLWQIEKLAPKWVRGLLVVFHLFGSHLRMHLMRCHRRWCWSLEEGRRRLPDSLPGPHSGQSTAMDIPYCLHTEESGRYYISSSGQGMCVHSVMASSPLKSVCRLTWCLLPSESISVPPVSSLAIKRNSSRRMSRELYPLIPPPSASSQRICTRLSKIWADTKGQKNLA